MREWSRVKLDEVISPHRGISWSKAQETTVTGHNATPVLRIPNIQRRLDTTDLLFIDGVPEFQKLRFAATKDWILMVGSNGNPERVGNCVLIRDENEYLFASFLLGLEIIDKEKALPEFIYHLLSSVNLQKTITNDVKGSTGLRNIDIGRLLEHGLDLPTLHEQRKIAHILTTVDNLIERTEALIAKVQAVKQGLLHDLLTRGVDAQGRLRPPREEAPDLYKESPLGWIPHEWEIVNALDCAADAPGSTTIGPFGSNLVMEDYRPAGVPVVFVRDVKPSRFEWNSGVYVDEMKARELHAHSVQPGDLIATKMGLPPCVACVYPDWMTPGVVTADIIRLRPNLERVVVDWLVYFINSEYIESQVRGITAGVTRPKVTLRDFRYLRVALPSIAEQEQHVKVLLPVEKQINALTEETKKYQKIKAGMMHDLLSGEVRVSIDEVFLRGIDTDTIT